uniref:Cnidarian restricted protein n=1 Tax=Clytia hemisphaerica TaxID=252671 RepID=A0A7M5V0C7_9CNID
MMRSYIAICFLFGLTSAFIFGKKDPVYPDWDALSITFGKFTSLPQTEDEAVSSGEWTPYGGCGCKNATKPYQGKRYRGPGGTNNLLFGPHKNVVGIQIVLPDNFNIAKNWKGAHVKEGNTFVMTTYFTDPDLICSGKRIAPKGYVGDNLYIVMNNGPVKIPLKESDIGATKWTKGKCFYGMGQHYWYDVSKDMDCNDFARLGFCCIMVEI